jgi:hypothetical protein
MEDSIIISAIKEEQKETGPNHKSPLKPVQEVQVKVDKLQVDIESIKRDINIILDHINHQDRQRSKGWWY